MVHYDSIENGAPSGDRGLILMENMHSVEKVLGVDTFGESAPAPLIFEKKGITAANLAKVAAA